MKHLKTVGIVSVVGAVVGFAIGLFRTNETTVESWGEGSSIVYEAERAAIAVIVDLDDIESLGEFTYENGYTVRRYTVDIGSTRASSGITDAAEEYAGVVAFVRGVEHWPDLIKATERFDQVLLLIKPIPELGGVTWVTAFGILENGDVAIVDWADRRGEAATFNANRGEANAADVIAEVARIRLAEQERAGRPPVGLSEGMAVLDALWPDRTGNAAEAPAPEDVWAAVPPIQRLVDTEYAPTDVVAGRVPFHLLLDIVGDRSAWAGEAMYIVDAEGVLYGFDLDLPSHAAQLLLDPTNPVLVFAVTNDERYPDHDVVTTIDLGKAANGAGVLFTISLGNGGGPVVVTLGDTFDDLGGFSAALEQRTRG